MTPDSGDITGAGAAAQGQPPATPAIEIVQVRPAEIRKVRITTYGVAFPVTSSLVVTSAATVRDASEIQLEAADGTALKAELVRADDSSGLALVRVSDRSLAPLDLAAAFPGGPIQCAGYPAVNIFNPVADVLTGSSAAPADGWKVRLQQHPRLPGGPLLAGGKVVGVELASRDSDPASIPAATLDQIRKLLADDAPQRPGPNPDPAGVLLQVLATRESR